MANASQAVKIPYTVTAVDVASFFIFVPICWKSPFSDTNYAVAWDVEAAQTVVAIPSNAVYPGPYFNKTKTGLTVCVQVNGVAAGDQIVVHAIGGHK